MAPVDVTVDLAASPTTCSRCSSTSPTPEWVTICRAVLHLDPGTPPPGGNASNGTCCAEHPFVVTWTPLDELHPRPPPQLERTRPRTLHRLHRTRPHPAPGGGSRLRYRNDSRPPAASSGAAASRALASATTPDLEARESLTRLATLLDT